MEGFGIRCGESFTLLMLPILPTQASASPGGTAGCHFHCQGHPANLPHQCCPTPNANLCQSFSAPITSMAFLNMPNVHIKVLLPQQNTHRYKAPSKPRLDPGQGVSHPPSTAFHSLSQWQLHRNQHQRPFRPTNIYLSIYYVPSSVIGTRDTKIKFREDLCGSDFAERKTL